MTRNLYFTQGTKGEQNLIHDLIEEQIKMYGIECYYIPRKVYEDKLWNDIYHSQYRDSYLIEMYLENYEAFGGSGDMLSKFGLRVTDEISLTVSRRRWKDFVDLSTNKIVAGRPNDGDLIYFPLNQTVFEIKYVENQKPFYQLNSLYIYTMSCEIFEYGDSIFETGIEEIDNLEQESGVFPIYMFPNGFGHYKPDEKIIGTRFTATVSSAVVSGGALGALTITNAGSGYTTAPSVFFYDISGNYIATSTSTISGGKVTSIQPPAGAYTYSGAPIVIVDDSPKNYTGRVAEWRPTERVLDVAYLTGNFSPDEIVKGETSGAKWKVQSYDTLNMTDAYSENREIENKGDLIIDFTESNPFGEFGDIQGSF
jgi:hypothetical protein